MSTKTCLVLGAGCILGISVLGCLSKMDLAAIKTYIGSSVGAVIGLGLALGFSCDEMFAAIMNTNLRQRINPSIRKLLAQYGLDDCEALFSTLVAFFERREPAIRRTTFAELRAKYGRDIIMTGANIMTGQTIYYGPDETPAALVLEALRRSISVPLLFTPPPERLSLPERLSDELVLDGGIYTSYPIEYAVGLNGISRSNIIGIMIRGVPCPPPTDLLSFLYQIIYSMYNKDERRLCDTYADITICIAGCDNSLNFALGDDDKRRLFDAGIKQAQLI